MSSYTICWAAEDVTAKQTAEPAADYNMDFARIEHLKTDNLASPRCATLEQNYWRLDGSFHPFPDRPELTAWGLFAPFISNADGSLPTPITLTVTFTGLHSVPGVTLIFSPVENLFADGLDLAFYADDTLIAQGSFTPDHWRYACELKAENFNRMEVTFRHLNKGGCYLRLTGLRYGLETRFGQEVLKSAALLEEASPDCDRLPAGELEFSLMAEAAGMDFWDPASGHSLLQRRQALSLTDENGVRSTCFVKAWSGSETLLTITGQDAIGCLEDAVFAGGIYENITAAELAEAILAPNGFSFTMDADLTAQTLSGYLPRTTAREALRQLCFALGACVDTSRGGLIRIFSPITNAAANLPLSLQLAGERQAELSSPVTAVEVTAHTYVLAEDASRIYSDTLDVGEHFVTFRTPAKVASVEGETLLSADVNSARLQVDTEGKVVVTGYIYEDQQTLIRLEEEVPAGEAANCLQIKDATLLSPARARAAANRLFAAKNRLMDLSLGLLPGDVACGSLCSVEVQKGRYSTGFLTQVETDLHTGGLRRVVLNCVYPVTTDY